MDNLMTIKTIIRSFKLALGLNVNFSKISILGLKWG